MADERYEFRNDPGEMCGDPYCIGHPRQFIVDTVSGEELERDNITQHTLNFLNFLERGRRFSAELERPQPCNCLNRGGLSG